MKTPPPRKMETATVSAEVGSACDVVAAVFDGRPRTTNDVIAELAKHNMPAATVRSALLRLRKRGVVVNDGKRGSTPATWSLADSSPREVPARIETRETTSKSAFREAAKAYSAAADRILGLAGPFADGFRLATAAATADLAGDAEALRDVVADLEAKAFDAAIDGYIIRPAVEPEA